MKLRQPRAAMVGTRLGRCYELALKTVYENGHVDGITLVHGHVRNPRDGYLIFHAWVEFQDGPDAMLYDVSMDRYSLKETYYAWFNAEAERKYSFRECVEHGARSSHCGPWHEVDWSLAHIDPREEQRRHETRHLE